MPILLRHEEIVGLLSIDEVIEAIRTGLKEQGSGQIQLPTRITIDSEAGYGWLRLMPAMLNGSRYMGYKAMHSTRGVGVRYLVALYDLPTGELLALIDADWLTQQRTSATAAVATDELSRRDAQRVGLLGSSEQARALLAAVSRVRTLAAVKVFSPTPEHRQRFAETMGAQLGVPITPVENPEQAVRGSELVLSAFRAGTAPVIRADWLALGAHVAAISAVRPEARELEAEVWRRSAVVVDDRAHVFESGDGRAALGNGSIRPENVAELWEVVCERRPGRQHAEQVTLFKSVGTAAQDLSIAAAIYQRARAGGIGQDLGDFPHLRK